MLVQSMFFFFNDTATTEIYTLSLHDALPISPRPPLRHPLRRREQGRRRGGRRAHPRRRLRPDRRLDRKSTRLNSSHSSISYAVFCLKKKKTLITYQSHPPQHFFPIYSSVLPY